jgi:hypothetical protein
VKNAYNEQKICDIVTEKNHLAVIRCTYKTTSNNMKNILAHLNNTFNMKKTMLCRDVMSGCNDINHNVNIEPNWVLFNGAIGKLCGHHFSR